MVGIRHRIQRESTRELGDDKAVSILIKVVFTLCFCQNSQKFTPGKSEFYHMQFKKKNEGTSLEVQGLRLHLLMQRVQVQSLVGELSSHMACGQKNQNINWKQYCNKFNKSFKNHPHQRNLSKNEKIQQSFLSLENLFSTFKDTQCILAPFAFLLS